MTHPIFNNRASLVLYVSIFASIALVQCIALIYFIQLDINFAIPDALVFNLVFLLLGLVLWYPTRFIDFEHSTNTNILINHVAGALVTSALWIGVSYLILTQFIDDVDYNNFLIISLIWRFLIGLLFYSIIISINYLIIYYNNFRDKLHHESELSTLVKEAEIRTLKYQINPHFIFNSLNSISSLTISNPDKAREMTINLSTFLRGTLSKNEKQITKLSEELENVKLYLKIERVRFEGKFNLIEELSEECLQKEVPSMLLQPLFENAIKHGVYESLDLVEIRLKCNKEGEYLKITVSNNFDSEAAPRKGEGIGIKNIQNRLKLIYNRDNLLRVQKTENQFTVDVFIPLGD